MKLSKWAKKQGLCYQTAWNIYKKGLIPNAYQLPTGTIIVEDIRDNNIHMNSAAIYARVSNAENRSNLEGQIERLKLYCNAKGYNITAIVKEIGSGLNDKRPKLEKLLLEDSSKIIVIEHKDRLCRFGLNYIEKLLEKSGRRIEIINNVETDKEDLMQDFVSIITSFTARLYGLRRSKRKTEKIIKTLKEEEKEVSSVKELYQE